MHFQEVVEETAVCFCFVFNAKRRTKERDADDVGGGSLWAQDVVLAPLEILSGTAFA